MSENKQDSFSTRGKNYQKKVVQALFEDRLWAEQMFDILKEEYFDVAHLQLTVKILKAYYSKYQTTPTMETFISLLEEAFSGDGEKLLKDQIIKFLIDVKTYPLANDSDIIKDTAHKFCVRKSLGNAILDIAQDVQGKEFNPDMIIGKMQKAAYVGASKDVGHSYIDEFNKRCELTTRNGIPTGFDVIDDKNILNGGLEPGEMGTIIASAGCHTKGTDILMYDGSTKKVEDVLVGDLLMGPDSTPRSVLKLSQGTSKMYKIIPVKGDPFVVNEDHVLSLQVYKRGGKFDIENITVKNYIEKINTLKSYKKDAKLYRSSEIIFENNILKYNAKLKIDSYFLGLMIGDGSFCNGNISFCSQDDELINYIKKESLNFDKTYKIYEKKNNKASSLNITYKQGVKSKLAKELSDLGFYSARGYKTKDKFIPFGYKTSSVNDRRKLLAGLIDSDGYLHNNMYEICTKFKKLSEDILFVARSLGLAAYCSDKIINNKKYYRITISGDCYKIPCRLERKKASPRKQIKSVLRTGFSVEEVGVGEYFGFTVDKDHLYVMGDFTVTHNSGKSMMLVNIAANALSVGYNVIYYTLELAEHKIGLRFDANFSEIGQSEVVFHKESVREIVGKKCKGKLYIKSYPPRVATTNVFKSHIRQLNNQKGFKPDLIIIDYADIMGEVMTNVRRGGESAYESQGSVYEQIRAFSAEVGCPVWTASQATRAAASERILNAEHIAESFRKMHTADVAIGLSRTPEDKVDGTGRITLIKNRLGQDGMVFPITLDTSTTKASVFQAMSSEMVESLLNSKNKRGGDREMDTALFKKLKEKLDDRDKK